MRTALVALFLIVVTPTLGYAQRARTKVDEGNRLYRDGQYAQAHQRYLDALRDAPGSGIIRFNDGNALYKSEDFERALEAYRAAVASGDAGLQSRAWYNLGNALYRQQQLGDALEAYKQALRLNPQDADAKHNLERVLQRLQQQQQQQQQQQDQGQQDQSQPQSGQRDQPQQAANNRPQQGSESTEPGERDARPQDHHAQQQGRMSREEAERLLRAINEDPGKIQRRRRVTTARRRPRKDW